MSKKKIYIFDTSAFIKGMDVSVLDEYVCYTTSGVLSEIKHTFSKQKIDTAIMTGNLIIRYPDPQDVKKVNTVAKKSGDLQFLSTTDIGVIALAVTIRNFEAEKDNVPPSEVPLEVVTDDYSIQNVLSQILIPSHSYMQKGIEKFIQWQIYCPICKTIFASSENPICPKCEVRLKRRPIDQK